MAVYRAMKTNDTRLVRELLKIGLPMYNTNREGKSILSKVFKDYSEMETCKELITIFVEEKWIDVFRQSEYFS